MKAGTRVKHKRSVVDSTYQFTMVDVYAKVVEKHSDGWYTVKDECGGDIHIIREEEIIALINPNDLLKKLL